MRFLSLLSCFLLPLCLCAQVKDSLPAGKTDTLGLKQGRFNEKYMFYADLGDSLDCSFDYVNNRRSGHFRCTYANGSIGVDGYYSSGRRDSTWIFKKENGRLDHISSYTLGELREKRMYIYSTDKNATVALSEIHYYDKFGYLLKKEYYRNNILVKTKITYRGVPGSEPKNSLNLQGPFTISAGYVLHNGNSNFLELGIKKYSHLRQDDEELSIFQGISYAAVGADIGYNRQLQLYPRAGIGHYFKLTLLCANVNCILYNDQLRSFYPAIVPEAGFSLPYGIFQLTYGYNIFLGSTPEAIRKTPHVLSIHINIPLVDTGRQ